MANTNIAFGAHVWASGGKPLGHVTRFVVDPASHQLGALIVDHGPLSPQRVVDIALVDRSAYNEVFLSLEDAEVERLPPFVKRQVAEVREPSLVAPVVSGAHRTLASSPVDPYRGDGVPELYGDSLFETPLPETAIVETISSLPESSVVLSKHTAIVSSDGFTVGHLHALSIDEQHRIAGFVMTAGLVLKHHVRLPTSSVAELTHDRIALTQGRDAMLDSVEEADIQPA